MKIEKSKEKNEWRMRDYISQNAERNSRGRRR